MTGRLKREIKQTKPFASLETEAILNVQRTSDQFFRALSDAMKPMDISPTQYNALRILKGAGKDGLTCSEVCDRMVTRDPDITRLLDRLEARGLVQRTRSTEDRRVVQARITEKGLETLTRMTPLLEGVERKLLGHLGEDRLKTLIELLEAARAGSE